MKPFNFSVCRPISYHILVFICFSLSYIFFVAPLKKENICHLNIFCNEILGPCPSRHICLFLSCSTTVVTQALAQVLSLGFLRVTSSLSFLTVSFTFFCYDIFFLLISSANIYGSFSLSLLLIAPHIIFNSFYPSLHIITLENIFQSLCRSLHLITPEKIFRSFYHSDLR